MLKRSKPSFSKDSKAGELRRNNLGAHAPISMDARQVTAVPACLQRILSFTSGPLSNYDKSFLKVNLMSGNVCIVRCVDETKVQDVIGHVIVHTNGGQKSEWNLYSLMAVCETSGVKHWFHRDMTVSECYKELGSMHPGLDEWRFELRLRFFFSTTVDLLQTDRIAFIYLFDQVKNYLREQNAYEQLEKDIAIELVSLEIRLMLKDRIPKTPNRKVNNTVLEEQEWKKHLPLNFLPGSDAKNLCKSMQKALKTSISISEEECILKYLNLVSCSWRYFEESYECQFDEVISSAPVKVIVGPTVGIVYEKVSEPVLITLAKFDKIKTMETQDVGFGQLKITFHDGRAPLILKCLSKQQNRQLAYLIDGYCLLLKTSGDRICLRSITSETHAESTKEAPDYAILEENVENDIPLSVIKSSLGCPPSCTCLKLIETNVPVTSVSSTPDLISNAHLSSDSKHTISLQDPIFGSNSESDGNNHSTRELCNIPVSSQTNRLQVIGKLTFENIEEKLRRQRQESDDDAAWLHREEAKLIIGENNIKSPHRISNNRDDISKVSNDSISKTTEPSSIPVDLLNKVKLDRSGDSLYCATTSLVQSIVDLKCAVEHGETEGLVGSAKNVGVQLKTLLNIVHSEVSSLSPQTRHEVEMGQKTLSSDLGHLIDAMKMVLHYHPTDLAKEYRQKMVQHGHALAFDAKTLYDTVDAARKMMILTQDLASSKLFCDASDAFTSDSTNASLE